MWVVLVAAAAGAVARELIHPVFDGFGDAVLRWLFISPFGLLLTFVVVGRWKKGPTTFWLPTWPEFRRLLIGAPLGLLAVRLFFEDGEAWLWLGAGVAALELTLAVARGVCGVRDRKRRTNRYGTVTVDPYA